MYVLCFFTAIITGNYWTKVADELKKKPYSVILADKNAPNLEVWRRVLYRTIIHVTLVNEFYNTMFQRIKNDEIGLVK